MSKAFHYKRGTISERFWPKVRIKSDAECWEWAASLDTKGYGNFGVPIGAGRFRAQRAHRVAWELTHGPIGDRKIYVCHKCDNPPCVNPSHMFLGTAAENTRDCVSKGRLPDRSGERNSRAKLNWEIVRKIREDGMLASDVAKQFGVAKSTAHAVINGLTWT